MRYEGSLKTRGYEKDEEQPPSGRPHHEEFRSHSVLFLQLSSKKSYHGLPPRSSTFFKKRSSYVADIETLNIFRQVFEPIEDPPTGLRVSEAGRAYLYGSRPHDQVFEDVFSGFYAAQRNDGYPYCFCSLSDKPEGNGFDRRPRQSGRSVPQA